MERLRTFFRFIRKLFISDESIESRVDTFSRRSIQCFFRNFESLKSLLKKFTTISRQTPHFPTFHSLIVPHQFLSEKVSLYCYVTCCFCCVQFGLPVTVIFSHMLALTLFLVPILSILAEHDPFCYPSITEKDIIKAREQGEQENRRFQSAAENVTIGKRNELYDEYISNCNKLGKERERIVAEAVKHVARRDDYKLLLTLGMRQFVARFLTLPKHQFVQGIKELCTKFEMQLQCQRGFGESRTQILKRIEDLSSENGNLKILLDEQCAQKQFDPAPYFCISEDPYVWTKPCFKHMLKYNYTRYSAGRRIANIHFDAVKNVTLLTYDKDLNEENQILPVRDKVQSIMHEALEEIASIEGEKCEALSEVLDCILPFLRNKCGEKVESMLQTMIEVGYLAQERREDLNQHFKGFGVQADIRCKKIHPLI